MLGLTYRCQLSCHYCGCALYDKSKAEFSYDAFKKIIGEISGLPYLFICVSFFGGEPLLREDIFDLVSFARGAGLFCEIDSNGLLLNRENAARLKKAGLNHIFVTVDNTDPKEHDRIKGKDGCYEAAREGIKNCVKAGLSCSISTYASRANVFTGELGKIIELGRHLKVKSVRILPPVAIKNWGGEEAPGCIKEELVRELKKFLEPGFVYLESTRCDSPSAPKRCAFLEKEFFYISPGGDVQPCPYFPVSFGNVAQQSIETILNRMTAEDIFREGRGTDCASADPAIRNHFTGSGTNHKLPIKYY